MDWYYAQIDGDGVCFAVSKLAGEVVQDDMIPLAGYDETVLGKVYKNGVWSGTV